MDREKPIMVTGAAGFVGSALVRALLARGNSVLAVARHHGRPLQLHHPRLRQLAVDLPDVAPLEDAAAPSVIFHAAAAVDPTWADDTAVCHRVNLEGTRTVAEWALTRKAKLVLVSSIAAMGFYDAPDGVTEDSPCRPQTAYGRTKLAAEQAVSRLGPSGLQHAIVRLPTLYGPDDRYNFLALARAIARRYFFLIGGGTNRMSVMHIDNVVAALMALGRPTAAGLFLADDGEASQFRDIARAISLALGRSGWLPNVPLSLARPTAALLDQTYGRLGRTPPLGRARLNTLTVDFGFRINRIRIAGYRPVVPMRRAIGTTVAAFRRNGLL